jgi:two-component system nitrogen regulation response regulator NtrX
MMKILIVEDDELMQATLKTLLKDLEVTQARSMAEALSAIQKEVFAAAFLDINLKAGTAGDGIELLKKIREGDSYLPCVMISGIEDKATITKCLDLGAVDYVVKASGSPDIYRLALHKALTWRKLLSESQSSRVGLPLASRNPYEMYGQSQAIKSLKETISRVGKLPGPFLILGETGTGKELVARSLWRASGDNNRPFIALNCASLPENLVECELFCYERGAFTGALTTKTGLFEAANGGDIFLDEIGELTPELQAKLLRVLQEKRVRRLGSDKERPIDFRVITATHVDILSAVQTGDFRDDLFFRINVHQIKVVPLRERGTDIPILAKLFLEELGFSKITFNQDVQTLLENFQWPGNIRQLKAFCQGAVPYLQTAGGGANLTSEVVKEWIKVNDVRKAGSSLSKDLDPTAEIKSAFNEKKSINIVSKLDALQRSYVDAALLVTQNNRSQAAKLLGVSRQRLSNWLSEWGMP